MVVPVIYIRSYKAIFFIKSRDLFPLIAGFLFSRDTEKRLIHDEHIRCKSMTPKTIYFYFVFHSPFYCENL